MLQYKDLKIITGRPYEYVYLPTHHLAQNDGTVGVHILVAEDLLHRPLSKDMVVHHKDFDKKNNDPQNLMVFEDRQSHGTYHTCLKYGYDYVLICRDSIFSCVRLTKTKKEGCGKRIVHMHPCKMCGVMISKQRAMCWDCYCKVRHAASSIPDEATLIEDLKATPNFVKVGKMYGVSDNAVRKWCRKYGISDKSSYWRRI